MTLNLTLKILSVSTYPVQKMVPAFGSFGNEPMQSCSVHRVSLLLLASASVYSPPSGRFDHRSFISYTYMHAAMPLVYAHEILSQCDIYFLNGGHFSKFLYLALLST